MDSPPTPHFKGVFDLGAGVPGWWCSRCGNFNPMTADACAGCQISFRDSLRRDDPGGKARGGRARRGRDRVARLQAHAGAFDRYGSNRPWRAIRSGLSVLARDPEVLVVPLVCMALSLGVAFGFFQLWATLERASVVDTSADVGDIWTALWSGLYRHVTLIGATFYLQSLVFVFCYAAMAAVAYERLSGRDPRALHGLGAALRRIGPLMAWGLIVGTVNACLQTTELVGAGKRRTARSTRRRLVARVAGVAWSSITFFVIPSILFESKGPIAAVKRSAGIFKNRWGETFLGGVGVGVAVMMLEAPFFLAARLLIDPHPQLAAELLVYSISVTAVIGATLSGILSAALYRYAVDGEAEWPFPKAQLEGTFGHGETPATSLLRTAAEA